jgi:hypothetical protein
MKKALLVLVLMGLVIGLARAQTPQVREIWSVNFPERVHAFAMREAVEQRIPSAIVVTLTGTYKVDSLGNVKELFSLGRAGYSTFPILSRNGRFIAFNLLENEGTKKTARVIDLDQNGKLLFQKSDITIKAINNEGTLFIGEKGTVFGLSWRTAKETLLVIDRSGQIKREIPTPWSTACLLSPDGSQFVVSSHDPRPGNPSPLIALDSSGKELWRNASVFHVVNPWARPSLFANPILLEIALGGTIMTTFRSATDSSSWVRFYGKDGAVLSDTKLGQIWRRDRSWPTNYLRIRQDGQVGLVVIKDTLFYLESTKQGVQWKFGLSRDKGEWKDVAFTPDYSQIIGLAAGERDTVCTLLGLNLQGRLLWEKTLNQPSGHLVPIGRMWLFCREWKVALKLIQ